MWCNYRKKNFKLENICGLIVFKFIPICGSLLHYFMQSENKHKLDMKHYPDIITTVSVHLNSPGHSIKEFSFIPIYKVTGNWKCLWRRLPGCIVFEQCVLLVSIPKQCMNALLSFTDYNLFGKSLVSLSVIVTHALASGKNPSKIFCSGTAGPISTKFGM